MNNTGFYISCDKTKLDIALIHEFLSKQSYWAENRERAIVEKSIEHSLCFGVYAVNGEQARFARVVTDFAVYAYIMDLFIIGQYRGQGLGKLLMAEIINNPDLQLVKRWTLGTKDAHGLYKQFGFVPVAKPGRWMERFV
jgi:GNAT superfamily N-acetyltransferase